MENCCICGKKFEVGDFSSVLRQKGVDSIKNLNTSINAQVGDRVHKGCRHDLIRKPYTKAASSQGLSSEISVSRRSQTPKYNPKNSCIFCGQTTAKYDGKKKGFDTIQYEPRISGLNRRSVQKEI